MKIMISIANESGGVWWGIVLNRIVEGIAIRSLMVAVYIVDSTT